MKTLVVRDKAERVVVQNAARKHCDCPLIKHMLSKEIQCSPCRMSSEDPIPAWVMTLLHVRRDLRQFRRAGKVGG